jgi:hypothetical protein
MGPLVLSRHVSRLVVVVVVVVAVHDAVTGVAARAFGIWTLLSCTLTLLCAVHITCAPLYHATLASFAIALGFFAVEFFVYETVSTKTILAPSIIACTHVPSIDIITDQIGASTAIG